MQSAIIGISLSAIICPTVAIDLTAEALAATSLAATSLTATDAEPNEDEPMLPDGKTNGSACCNFNCGQVWYNETFDI